MYGRVKFVVQFVFFVAIAQNYFAHAATKADYCRLCSSHTMCLYTGVSSDCTRYVASPLTSAQQSALVKKHNDYRQLVASGQEKRGVPGPQPKASNMKELVWDTELATIAQRWGDQCIDGHDKCRTVQRYPVGQNIATKWSSGALNDPIESLVVMWYEEVTLFSASTVPKYQFSTQTGHYSQLVWANTSRLGCAVIKNFDFSMNMNKVRLICNYGAAGNYVGSPVYLTGETGSACTTKSTTYPGLCA